MKWEPQRNAESSAALAEDKLLCRLAENLAPRGDDALRKTLMPPRRAAGRDRRQPTEPRRPHTGRQKGVRRPPNHQREPPNLRCGLQ